MIVHWFAGIGRIVKALTRITVLVRWKNGQRGIAYKYDCKRMP